MSLNALNRFTTNPVNVNISRSTFDMSHGYKTTLTSGKVVPVFINEVYPGDTFKVCASSVIRMITPVVPVMDNCFADIDFFFVPNRLIWDHWKEFMGENTSGYWAPSVEYTIPQVTFGTEPGQHSLTDPTSLACYFGIPTGTFHGQQSFSVSALPFRAYNLIWNEWFRDQNTQAPVDINTSMDVLSSCKFHDYFTSCLPAPQKGEQIKFDLLGDLPVVPGTAHENYQYMLDHVDTTETSPGTTLSEYNGITTEFVEHNVTAMQDLRVGGSSTTDSNGSGNPAGRLIHSQQTISGDSSARLFFDNLVAKSSEATLATVNSLRQAFAVQRALEKDARGGTRYSEMIKAHFNVFCPDYRVQRPEFLGGQRFPINVSEVLQTSSTDSVTPLGFTGAKSLTNNASRNFVKSFLEHGYVIGVLVIRPMQSYSQGIERFWSRLRRFDYYIPSFANLGEQAVKNKEIYVDFTSTQNTDEEIFGYQEAWADLRYKTTRVTGNLAPKSGQASFLPWTFSLAYSSLPVLNSDFMKQSNREVAQVLTGEQPNSAQFICDLWFNFQATRPLPYYSIPGLIDHM